MSFWSGDLGDLWEWCRKALMLTITIFTCIFIAVSLLAISAWVIFGSARGMILLINGDNNNGDSSYITSGDDSASNN